jgi:hypothetical protein
MAKTRRGFELGIRSLSPFLKEARRMEGKQAKRAQHLSPSCSIVPAVFFCSFYCSFKKSISRIIFFFRYDLQCSMFVVVCKSSSLFPIRDFDDYVTDESWGCQIENIYHVRNGLFWSDEDL